MVYLLFTINYFPANSAFVKMTLVKMIRYTIRLLFGSIQALYLDRVPYGDEQLKEVRYLYLEQGRNCIYIINFNKIAYWLTYRSLLRMVIMLRKRLRYYMIKMKLSEE
jgi:hypothetical protein